MDHEARLRNVDAAFSARDFDGTLLFDREVTHAYAFRDGLVVRMDVIEPQE